MESCPHQTLGCLCPSCTVSLLHIPPFSYDRLVPFRNLAHAFVFFGSCPRSDDYLRHSDMTGPGATCDLSHLHAPVLPSFRFRRPWEGYREPQVGGSPPAR